LDYVAERRTAVLTGRLAPHQGRLTSRKEIKTTRTGIAIRGAGLPRDAGVTLIGRARGERFVRPSGPERMAVHQSLEFATEESARHWRKCGGDDG
jgi:FdhD protein